MPKFSVITINYNNKEGLVRTIQSTISQTFKDYEFIIVDGGSIDGSREIIDNSKEYLSWWCSEPDQGVYNAMNKGVKHAKGEYCIFMNSGDYFYNEQVLENVNKLNANCDFLYGYTLNPITDEINNVPITNLLVTLITDSLSHQATFIKKKVLEEYPYDENLKIVSDWKLWIEAILFGQKTFQNINIKIAYQEAAGLSSNKNAHKNERQEVLMKYFAPAILNDLEEYGETFKQPVFHRLKYIQNKHQTLYRIINGTIKIIYNLMRK